MKNFFSIMVQKRFRAFLFLGMVALFFPLASFAGTTSSTTLSASSLNPSESTLATPQPVTLTASIVPSTATGFVSFYDGSVLIGSVEVSPANPGTAVLSHVFPVGSHVITAHYSGNSLIDPSVNSSPLNLVTQGKTTHTLALVGVAGNYQLTDTVTGDGLIYPTGQVTFTDQTNNAVVGTAPLDPGNGSSTNTFVLTGGGSSSAYASVAQGDFNNDGRLDAVLTSTSTVTGKLPGIALLLATSTTPAYAATSPNIKLYPLANVGVVAAGDFNNDGNLDVVVSTTTGTVTLYLGDGTGNLTASSSVSVACGTDIKVADLNRDGYLDFVCADNTAGTVTPVLNNGSGGFTVGTALTATGVQSLAVGPLTTTVATPVAASIPAIIFTTATSTTPASTATSGTYVYTGNGDGTFTLAQTYLSSAQAAGSFTGAIVLADADGDGNTDIFGIFYSTYYSGTRIAATLGHGDGSFLGGTISFNGALGTRVATGDFNGDGLPDFALDNGTNGQWYLNTTIAAGSPTISMANISGYTSISISANSPLIAGDYSGTGLADVYWPDINYGSEVLAPYNRSVSSAVLQTPGPAGNGTTHLVAATTQTTDFYTSATPSPSNTVSMVSLRQTPTVSVSANAPVLPLGQTFTFDAQVIGENGLTPTGTVTFTDTTTGTVLGTATLSSGSALITANNLAGGNHTIQASYTGDTNYNTGSGQVGVAVSPGQSTLLLSASSTRVTPGTAITFTASLQPVSGLYPAAGELMTFYANGQSIGTAAINATGTASLVSTLAAGYYSISASYVGDSSFNTAASNTVGVRVGTTRSSVSLSSSLNPSVVGQSVTFTATVTGSTPTGTVTFYNGNTSLGTGTLSGSGVATLTTPFAVAGTYGITASYSGDTNNGAATSSTLVQVVNAPAAAPSATVVLTPNNQSVAPGGSLSFTVIVTGNQTGIAPNGTVGLVVDGVASSLTPTVSSLGNASTYTFTTTAVAPFGSGQHAVSANYSGDTNATPYPNTSSNLGNVTVSAAPVATVSLAASPSTTVAQGATVTLTATVGGNSTSPTGVVTFYNNGASIGTGTISGGVASLASSSLSLGANPITAVYSGDTTYGPATSNLVIENVVTATPATVSLSSLLNPSVAGQSVTFTATVTGNSPTGTVTFYNGNTSLGTGTVSNGVATLTTPFAVAGTYGITASYGGDTNNGAATSSTLVQVVNAPAAAAAASVALTPNNQSVSPGGALSFTVTVTGNQTGVAPNGTVGLVVDGVASSLTPTVSSSGDVSTYTFTTTAVAPFGPGQHAVSADYSGDTNTTPYPNANSNLGNVTVSAASVATVSLSASPSTTVTQGATVTFTATVGGNGASPTGTVTFYNNGTSIGTGTISGGVASLTTSTLAVGANPITAVYGGDSTYGPATSNLVIENVVKATPAGITLASSLNPSVVGQSVTFTATVTGSTPTGTVTFYNGNTSLGTGTLSGSGVATLATPFAVAGTYGITASYGGDTNNGAATSSTLVQVVNAPAVAPLASVTLTASPGTSITAPASATFTATVTGSAGTPGGTVTFYNGANGTAPGAVLGTSTLNAAGVASLTVASVNTVGGTPLGVGNNPITAVYGGNATYGQASSNVVVESVLPLGGTSTQGDFAVAVSTPSATVLPGQAVSYTIAVSDVTAAFNSPVTLTVTTASGQTGLPAGATATFVPATVTPGGGTATATLTIQTSTTVASIKSPWMGPSASLALLLLPILGSRRARKRLSSLSRAGLVIVFGLLSLGTIVGLSGCGSGNGYFGAKGGTYTFTVTGTSGTISHNAPQSVTLTLQ